MDVVEKTVYFKRIIADNDKAIRRVVFFYCPDKQLANDLYQEVVTNIWESLDSFKGNARIGTWIYRITLNISIMYNKRYINKKQIIYFPDIPEFGKYLTVTEKDLMIEKLYTLIEQLNTTDREIMLLYLDKRSHKEIAGIMELSATNIGTRISRIVQKLKEINSGTGHE